MTEQFSPSYCQKINRTRRYESPISIRDNNLIKACNPKPEIIR